MLITQKLHELCGVLKLIERGCRMVVDIFGLCL